MQGTPGTTVQCPQCRQPNQVVVDSMIDANQDPEAKIRLLSGQLNTTRCAGCGTVFTVAAPLLYHDADKELLISYVPMELAMPKDQQDRVMASMMRQLTGQIPQDRIKGYLFRPKEALTLQGMIDQILQADGVTPEMIESQRGRMRLIEKLMEAGEADLPDLVAQHDAEIDGAFFQAVAAMGRRALQENRPDIAQRLMLLQSEVAGLSTYGQQMLEQAEVQETVVQAVAEELDALGEDVTRADFVTLAVGYAGDDQRLQALVGLARPAMDYEFFQELTLRTGQAPAEERAVLEGLRARLLELTSIVDQQAQMAVQGAVQFLQLLVNSPQPAELIRSNIDQIDDTFMSVLVANVQEAQRRGDVGTSGRLREIYEQVVSILQENMQPELRFINELLSTETDEAARDLLISRFDEYAETLVPMLDAVGQVLAQRGEPAMIEKLAFLRQVAVHAANR